MDGFFLTTTKVIPPFHHGTQQTTQQEISQKKNQTKKKISLITPQLLKHSKEASKVKRKKKIYGKKAEKQKRSLNHFIV